MSPQQPARDAPSDAGVPPDEPVLTVSRDTTDQAVIVTAAGDVDMVSVDELFSEVLAGLREPVGHPVIVDLTRVNYLGSHGLRALVRVMQEADRQNEPLRIVVDHHRPVVRPLQITGLDKVLALYHTVDDALALRAAN